MLVAVELSHFFINFNKSLRLTERQRQEYIHLSITVTMESLHVGEPPSDFECWESITILHIHNFMGLRKKSDKFTRSPEFTCFGHGWRVDVSSNSDYDDGGTNPVVVLFRNLSKQKITVSYKITLLKADGSESKWSSSVEEREFGADSCFAADLVNRAAVLVESPAEYLDNEALKIKVQMKLSKKYHHNIMNIYQSAKTSDVAFAFEEGILVAHKCIIESKAENLYAICGKFSVASPVPIKGVSKYIFDIMLRTLYGDEVCSEVWQKHSESILKAASKYGFTSLKTVAEAWYVKSLQFTADNVISKFMEADGDGYVLVKAAAKKYMTEHGKEVVATDSFANLYESKKLAMEVAAHLCESGSMDLVMEMKAAALENGKKRKRDDE